MRADWYPTKIELLPDWHQNFVTQLPTVAAKYGITAGQMADAQKDSDWVAYWVNALNEIKQQVDQLEEYFEQILKLPKGSPEPLVPVITLPANQPGAVLVGVRERTREIANFIKGNPNYSKADGELLGIVSSPGAPPNLGELIADFKARTLPVFDLEITFKKQGMDGIRLEIRFKGGVWVYNTTLTSSPGVIHVNPQVVGVAEQVEVRGIMTLKNEAVGNYSDTKTAFIAP